MFLSPLDVLPYLWLHFWLEGGRGVTSHTLVNYSFLNYFGQFNGTVSAAAPASRTRLNLQIRTFRRRVNTGDADVDVDGDGDGLVTGGVRNHGVTLHVTRHTSLA